MAAVATSIPASMKRETLTLNPNAPLFVPAAFLAAEDFSPEWWCLVHTCPAFREYWLHEYCLTDPDQFLLQHRQMTKKGENDGFDRGSAEVEAEVDLVMEFNKFQVDSENMPPFSSTEKIEMVLSHLKPKKKKKQGEMYSKPLPPPKPILRPQKSALCSKTIHQPR